MHQRIFFYHLPIHPAPLAALPGGATGKPHPEFRQSAQIMAQGGLTTHFILGFCLRYYYAHNLGFFPCNYSVPCVA
jgi:hypothetical protein